MIQEDLADFSVNYALKLGAKYAEVRLEQHKGTSFLLKNGIPEVSGFDDTLGMGVRFLVKDTLGFVSINNLQKELTKDLIKKAFKLTEDSYKLTEKTKLTKEDVIKTKYEVKQKIKLENISPEEKLKFLKGIDKETKQAVGRFYSLSDDVMHKYYVNSEGAKITQIIPRTNFFYYITVNNKADSLQRFLQHGNVGGWESVKAWNLSEKIKDEIKAMLRNLKEGKKLKPGKYDVVVAPEVTAIMTHEAVGHPTEADRILGREGAQAGESFVTKDMLNKKLGSELLTVADDPTIPGSNGFFLYDDEGVKARRKLLMKDGKINEFLHNRETAAEMGTKSNGSSRANDYDKETIVRMSNTFVLPGKTKEEEMIKEIKNGVYIKNFMEWNIDDKRFHQKYVGCESYSIVNGELGKPIRNPALEITTPGLWSSVDAVGKNIAHFSGTCGKGEPMQGIPVWFGGPSLRLKNIVFK
ncbi:MAG: TldD/PmbA family protein [Candidatus Nanoarchaeia archaeon]|nr:TldD/PmbA family protein [Candidatus Nanoarchaeia archaeon]MDD5588094.1 TldD/PmbA family protein [Candidatus Nanoarchaeia archaeon]